jgi:hypothetical protein
MTLESWSMGIVRPVMEVHPMGLGVLHPVHPVHHLHGAQPVHRRHRVRDAEGTRRAEAAATGRPCIRPDAILENSGQSACEMRAAQAGGQGTD